MNRRLTTILSADVVEYSRLMGEDEAGTLAELKRHRNELIDPKADQYGGRTIKLMGDGTLMEFASVVDAVVFAVEVQCAMRDRNRSVPVDQRIVYRIGINIGDIIVEGDDIYGDGVNIAARLEGLSEPGGIFVARNVYNQVKSKLDLTFDHQGEQEVKNIAEPVTVYRVNLDDNAEKLVTPAVKQPVPNGRHSWPAVAAVAILALLGAALWWQPWAPDLPPASMERMAHALPDRPSIAVLPFDNMSKDDAQDYFTDGLTEDLITDLSKVAGLFVIARNSTFTYKDKPVKVQQVAEELGVRYVLEGSVRRIGDHVRINAQLIDALQGHHIWAERYDGSLSDLLAMQDKVLGLIVKALKANLNGAGLMETLQADTKVPQAYDAFLQGRDHHRRQTAQDAAKAIKFFEKAIELDPSYARAYAGLAAVYWDMANLGWYWDLDLEWKFALDQAKANLAKGMEQPASEALALSAEMLLLQGQHEEAMAAIDRALEVDPNAADSYLSKARVLNALGQAKAAENQIDHAMRLNPLYPVGYLRALGRSLFHQKRYAEAAEILERLVSRQDDNPYDFATLAAVYGHMGRIDDAQAAAARYNEIYGEHDYTPITVQEIGWWWYGDIFDYNKAYIDDLLAGLRKAGIPEGAAPETPDFQFAHLLSKKEGIYEVDGVVHIDAETAKRFADQGVAFVDVRDRGSFGRGHLPNADHLDLNLDLTEENLEKLADKDDPVVFYCWGEECTWSAYAAAKAITWGFNRVYRFSGGFPAWKRSGYPIDVHEGY